MLRVNVALGVTVFLCWLIFGGEHALNAVANNWRVSLTMVFGSLVGGGTSEGGGAVGFPVLTKVLTVPADQARLFSFAIQSVGMGCATISIVSNRVAVEWRAIRFGAPAAIVGVFVSCIFLAPHLPGGTVRLLFTAVLAGLALALWVSRRFAPDRRDAIGLLGRPEMLALVGAGLLGGLLSGLAAVGENTIMFVLLVLGFRVCERVVTPTTVVLLTIVTWTGFLTHLLVMGDFRGPVVDMWLAAVPVVAIGAPTGALLCTRLSRDAIVRILYVLIAIEFTSTLLLVPMSGWLGVTFGIAIIGFTLLCVRMATWRRYRVSAEELVAVGAPR
ncbi:MAG TPA: TSUP family transporter [Candidatus Limnocylindrales bacterium]